MIELPEVVRNRAIAEGHADWIDDLTDLVRGLERDWSIELRRTYDEGTEAFVADVVMAEGTPAVLKVLLPRRGGGFDDHEATVLRLAAGDGCPVLYRDDPARGALLMEQLGSSMFDLGLPYRQRLPALCDAAAQIWRPAHDIELPTGADKAAWLTEYISTVWTELDEPCERRTVDHALACAERRLLAHDPERAVLVHGDVHQWNALQASDSFKLVDPDGLVAEPEYDLGVILREDPDEPAAADTMITARRMAARHGLDATAIWEWGVVERVSTGLVATKIDLQPVGRHMLALADRIASEW
ncbi:MAG TPA: aminoglycoside phosphotransferase family protein [Ilumatobacteraceae bacterium]|nr:aminoglycoside phosphotransferase family protein [Ilumatobacteraceae bacterium]